MALTFLSPNAQAAYTRVRCDRLMLDEDPHGANVACVQRPASGGLAALGADRSRADDERIGVRIFRAHDTPAVLGLLRSAFGRWPSALQTDSEEFFRWKHLRSPFGASTLLVAEADGELVGFLGYMPWRLQARDRTVTSLREVDLAVHPAHRRRGISMRLRSAAVFSPDVSLLWSNPNEQSRPGGLQLGQAQVGRVSRFVRPAQPLRSALRLAGGAPKHLRIDVDTATGALADDASVAHVRSLSAGPGERLTTISDLAYLRWRYGRSDEYRAVRNSTGDGIAIFRCAIHGRFSVAHVCELLVQRDDRRAAARLLRQVGAAAGVDFVSCNFAGKREAARHGFVAYPGKEILMTRVLDGRLAPDPTDGASWALSHGDMELL